MNKKTLKDQAWSLLSKLYEKRLDPTKTKLNRVFIRAIRRYQRRLKN